MTTLTMNKINFRLQLEQLDRGRLLSVACVELIDFIKIDILLDQYCVYCDYMFNLLGVDWDEDEFEAIKIYPELRNAFESLDDEELDSYFTEFAWAERVIDELMFLDKEARDNLLENIS